MVSSSFCASSNLAAARAAAIFGFQIEFALGDLGGVDPVKLGEFFLFAAFVS